MDDMADPLIDPFSDPLTDLYRYMDNLPHMNTIGNDHSHALNEELIEVVGEGEEGSSEAGMSKKRKLPTESASKPQKKIKEEKELSVEGEDGGKEPPAKNSKSVKKEEKTTPQCVLCEAYPPTALGYANHLEKLHKSTLKEKGIYLVCSCGDELRYRISNHNKKCDGKKFALHKLDEKIHDTPQCLLCELHPKTPIAYAIHLRNIHKATLSSIGFYLSCSCGYEVTSHNPSPNHKECEGLTFTLHKFEVKPPPLTPQCVMCEAYPSTASGYAKHLVKHHRSSLKSKRIYLICLCGYEVYRDKRDPDHSKKCEGLTFTLHELDENISPSTPQCIMCEAYPTTARGYARHLVQHHSSSLKSKRIYLICSCGQDVRRDYFNPDHNKDCDGKKFALHKLDKE